jgi:hypothetical protein
MQTTNPRHGDNPAVRVRGLRSLAASSSVLVQPEVRSVFVVITNVIRHKTLQVPLIESDHTIEPKKIGASIQASIGESRADLAGLSNPAHGWFASSRLPITQ